MQFRHSPATDPQHKQTRCCTQWTPIELPGLERTMHVYLYISGGWGACARELLICAARDCIYALPSGTVCVEVFAVLLLCIKSSVSGWDASSSRTRAFTTDHAWSSSSPWVSRGRWYRNCEAMMVRDADGSLWYILLCVVLDGWWKSIVLRLGGSRFWMNRTRGEDSLLRIVEDMDSWYRFVYVFCIESRWKGSKGAMVRWMICGRI